MKPQRDEIRGMFASRLKKYEMTIRKSGDFFQPKGKVIDTIAFEHCRERISLYGTFIATSEHTLNSAYNRHESRARRSP